MSLEIQLISLFVLPLAIASIAWTVTHEEVTRELHEWCRARSISSRHWYQRKLFYLFTCEYCTSHYVTLLVLLVTRYQLIYSGWRGYCVAGFSLVWIANIYMSFYGRIRLDIRRERAEISQREEASQFPIKKAS